MKRTLKAGLLAITLIWAAAASAQQCGDGFMDAQGLCHNTNLGTVPMGTQGIQTRQQQQQPQQQVVARNFGAVAYGPGTQWATSENFSSSADAERAAVQGCGHKDCWAYSFQGGFGAIARQIKGRELFGEWSGQSRQQAEAAAMRSCEKETGKGKCQVVVSGAAEK